MKIKVSQATNVELDWLAGTIEHSLGFEYRPRTKKCYAYDKTKLMKVYSPTTSWAQGGEIIGREIGNLWKHNKLDPSEFDVWTAAAYHKAPDGTLLYYEEGPTPLVAAMRCYVASRLGDEVEIPEELAC